MSNPQYVTSNGENGRGRTRPKDAERPFLVRAVTRCDSAWSV
jgi:hypothetical protein